jgi:hypothetical protein
VKETEDRNRILSYQFACVVGDAKWSGIVFPPRPGARLLLSQLLGKAVSAGIEGEHITRWPTQVIVTAHWTRADLSAFDDFRAIKNRLDGVRKTYVTTGFPLKVACTVAKHLREFSVTLLDTQLLTPATSKSLDGVGKLLGFEKIKLPELTAINADGTEKRINAIERMDLLLEKRPRTF